MAKDKIYGMPVGDLHKGEGHPQAAGEGHGVVETFEGWYSLHTVYAVNYGKWQSLSEGEQKAALAEFKEFLKDMEANHEAHEGSYAMYHVIGQKGDLMFWFLRPTPDDLAKVETRLQKLMIASVFEKGESFVSVIEVSNYFHAPLNHPKVQARLYPSIPRLQYMCFYPMSKKRDGADNWYMTSSKERARMMRSHGMIGKKYENEIKEYTTSACGMDDYEWGITLMGDDAVKFKKIVYEMRFDEVSARFGIFGPFVLGCRLTEEGIDDMFA